MTRESGRKPVVNFFVKKPQQIGLALRIVGIVALTTMVSTGIILLLYYLRNKNVLFYEMHESGELSAHNFLSVLMPALIVSMTVNVIVAFCIGLYASRKYAVPIFKLEKWAMQVKNGVLTEKLRFREKRELAELMTDFNEMGEELRGKFKTIRDTINALPDEVKTDDRIATVSQIVSSLKLDE